MGEVINYFEHAKDILPSTTEEEDTKIFECVEVMADILDYLGEDAYQVTYQAKNGDKITMVTFKAGDGGNHAT